MGGVLTIPSTQESIHQQEPSNPPPEGIAQSGHEEVVPEIQENSNEEGEREDEDEEEEGECGFCLFMKGGGCKEQFVEWEKCVEEGEKNKEDIVEKCYSVTTALKVCMEAHPDYYGPILKAEKAAEAEAKKELKKNEESESVVTMELEKEGHFGDSEGKGAS